MKKILLASFLGMALFSSIQAISPSHTSMGMKSEQLSTSYLSAVPVTEATLVENVDIHNCEVSVEISVSPSITITCEVDNDKGKDN